MTAPAAGATSLEAALLSLRRLRAAENGRAVARIDLGAVERNCRVLRRLAGGAELCAVVKADGYGHGAEECARAALAGGATWLAVATAAEALELRACGLETRLLVLGAMSGPELAAALEVGADVVAWTAEFVAAAAQLAPADGPLPRLHVKLDTGMGRLGTRDEHEAAYLCDAIAAGPQLELAGLMTHFATADDADGEYLALQRTRFAAFARSVRRRHPGLTCHAANSAATIGDPASHFDMVRCGVAVYGLDPFLGDPRTHGLEPALSLHSYVAAVKRYERSASVGYGRTWRAAEPTWVAVLPIGYADGVRRALSNNAEVLIGGRRRPLVGRVSMDNVTVDVGPDRDVAIGDPAVLIGAQGGDRILCEEIARRVDTINQEVTCGLTHRVTRVFGTRGEPAARPAAGASGEARRETPPRTTAPA